MLSTTSGTSAKRQFDDINVIREIGQSDEDCLAEIREVLAKHNCLDRFGVTLLHTHFDMDDDEILMETCDPATRTLTITPIKKADMDPDDVIITNWSLNNGESLQGCSKKDHFMDLQGCSKKDHVMELQGCSKKDHVMELQACSKKDHMMDLQACSKKDHRMELQGCSKKDHFVALQACSKKDH